MEYYHVIIVDDLVQQIETLINTVNGISTVIQQNGIKPAEMKFRLSNSISGSTSGNCNHGVRGSARGGGSIRLFAVKISEIEVTEGTVTVAGPDSYSGTLSINTTTQINLEGDFSFSTTNASAGFDYYGGSGATNATFIVRFG